MTIQPDEEELHVIPNAGAPGTAGGGFRVVDRTDATDAEFRARIAVFDAAEEPEEVTVERVARALWEAQMPTGAPSGTWVHADPVLQRLCRRLAPAAIAAMPTSRAEEALRRVEALAAELDERGDIEHAEWRQRGQAQSLGRRDAYETSAELVRAALAPLAGQRTTDEEGR